MACRYLICTASTSKNNKFDSIMLLNCRQSLQSLHNDMLKMTMNADAVLLITGVPDNNSPNIKTLASLVKSRNSTVFDSFREILLISTIWQILRKGLPSTISFDLTTAESAYLNISHDKLKLLLAATQGS